MPFPVETDNNGTDRLETSRAIDTVDVSCIPPEPAC